MNNVQTKTIDFGAWCYQAVCKNAQIFRIASGNSSIDWINSCNNDDNDKKALQLLLLANDGPSKHKSNNNNDDDNNDDDDNNAPAENGIRPLQVRFRFRFDCG